MKKEPLLSGEGCVPLAQALEDGRVTEKDLTYSCLPQEDIDRMTGLWEAQWDAFVQGF